MLLYVLRIVIKVVFKTEYVTGLHVATTRVWVEAALLSGFALAVYLLRPRPAAARV